MILFEIYDVMPAVRSNVVTGEEIGELGSDASKPDWKRRVLLLVKQWALWLFVVILTVCAGVWLIPLFRGWPADVHVFFNKLHPGQRISFTLFVCASLAVLIANLFQPCVNQLRHFFYCPPMWTAAITGVICVAALDLTHGLTPDGYKPEDWEWPVYAGGAVALAFVYRAITRPLSRPKDQEVQRWKRSTNPFPSNWAAMERWLTSDAPAEYDFLSRQLVAERIARRLLTVSRSIGIVGPYGTGKTSIVRQVELITKKEKPKLLFSRHSCWGFENSASAIHAMLAGGLEKVRTEIDVSHVTSLPESYRQTFSAGGEWLGNVSKLVVGDRGPSDQFERLSVLLGDLGARLVFVVEDLDRNDSESFDIQEVQAFLHLLKDFDNLSFILTGDTSPKHDIDFSKLCDQIEYLREVQPDQTETLISLLRTECLSGDAFRHEVLTPDDNPWVESIWDRYSNRDEVSPAQAIARLLDTPRTLRHVLGRTYDSWKHPLCGEVDWDHLLAVNALRHAAPEAFLFVFRHLNRIDGPVGMSQQRDGELEKINANLQLDWKATVDSVKWDTRAARAIIDFILPYTPQWLDGDLYSSGYDRTQGVHIRRYWNRIIDEDLGADGVIDQEVARDIKHWRESPTTNARLPTQICKCDTYSDVFVILATYYFGNDPAQLRLLVAQVLALIGQTDGPSASSESQGFASVWSSSMGRFCNLEGNRQWLEDRLTEAAAIGIQLINDIWHYWGLSGNTILRQEEKRIVRRHVHSLLRVRLKDAVSLEEVLSSKHPHAVNYLVSGRDHEPILNDVDSWSWLSTPLLDGLKNNSATIALQVCYLISPAGAEHQIERFSVDPELLFGFFGDRAGEAIDAIERVSEQVSDGNRSFVEAVVRSGRERLAEGPPEPVGDLQDVSSEPPPA